MIFLKLYFDVFQNNDLSVFYVHNFQKNFLLDKI